MLVRIEVLTAISIKIMVFWDAMMRSLVDSIGRCVSISKTTHHHISEHGLTKIHVNVLYHIPRHLPLDSFLSLLKEACIHTAFSSKAIIHININLKLSFGHHTVSSFQIL